MYANDDSGFDQPSLDELISPFDRPVLSEAEGSRTGYGRRPSAVGCPQAIFVFWSAGGTSGGWNWGE